MCITILFLALAVYMVYGFIAGIIIPHIESKNHWDRFDRR